MIFESAIERFLAKVGQCELTDQCWIWTASKDSVGYGSFGYEGRLWVAHRWIYIYLFGPIGDRLQLDHLCKNRACVNPQHLEAVTRAENVWRGDLFNRNKTHCKHGHEFTVENTYIRKDGKRQCKACTRRLVREMWLRKHCSSE